MTESNILNHPSYYRLSFQTYKKFMRQGPAQHEWIKVKLAPRICGLFKKKAELRVLAIASGSGEVDNKILDEIVKEGRECRENDYKVIYQVVEPNQVLVDYFKSTVEKNESLKNIHFDWFVGTFEDFFEQFQKKESDEMKFDFVHFVSCFYHINSAKGLNMTYKHFLKKDGIVAVVGENIGFWPNMMKFLHDHELTHEAFMCSGSLSDAYFLPGWISHAEKNKWSFESHTVKYNFDMTPVFGENSELRNYIIDFLFHTKDSRKVVKKDIMEDFFKFLENQMVEKEGEDENGEINMRKYILCEIGAIIITKE